MVSTGSLGSLFGLVESDGFGLSSLYSIIWGLLALLFAWGLWNLKNWARTGTLALQFLNLAAAIVALIGRGSVNWVGTFLSVVIILYLMQSRIRKVFS